MSTYIISCLTISMDYAFLHGKVETEALGCQSVDLGYLPLTVSLSILDSRILLKFDCIVMTIILTTPSIILKQKQV